MPEKEKGFKDWFTNVFWFHYKWWFLIAVFIVAVVIIIAVDSATTVEYDFTVVVSTDGEVAATRMEEILEIVAGSVGDLNGDGEVNVNFVTTANDSSRTMLYLSDDSYPLFLVDRQNSDVFTTAGYFEDELSSYGIEPDAENPYRVWLGDVPAFRNNSLELYGHIIDWTTVGKGSQAEIDAAVRALEAFLALQ